MTFALSLVALFCIYVYRKYFGRMIAARWYGTETEAVVNRIEKQVWHSSGGDYPVLDYYVRFTAGSGLENEARLLNPKRALNPGSRIRVRYLEDRADAAVMTEIIEK